MVTLRKVFRRWIYFKRYFGNAFRKLMLRMLYDNIHFGSNVFLDSGVRIVVTDGGRLVLGKDVAVERNTTIRIHGGSLDMGEGTYCGEGTIIASSSGIVIGRKCLIASGVVVRDMEHRSDRTDVSIKEQGNQTAPIHIGNDVWIGTKASVLAGVTIGDHSIIGAHALVNKDVPERTLAAGVPAKVIRSRVAQQSGRP